MSFSFIIEQKYCQAVKTFLTCPRRWNCLLDCLSINSRDHLLMRLLEPSRHDTTLAWCWASVADGGAKFSQHWVNIHCLARTQQWKKFTDLCTTLTYTQLNIHQCPAWHSADSAGQCILTVSSQRFKNRLWDNCLKEREGRITQIANIFIKDVVLHHEFEKLLWQIFDKQSMLVF